MPPEITRLTEQFLLEPKTHRSNAPRDGRNNNHAACW
jgi:hypothetical protein